MKVSVEVCSLCEGTGWKSVSNGSERRVTRCDCRLQALGLEEGRWNLNLSLGRGSKPRERGFGCTRKHKCPLDGPTQLQMFTGATQPPKGLNTSFFADPAIDKLTAEAALNLDDASRHQQLCQIQKEVWQKAPWIFLWSQTLVLGYNSKITGVSYLPNEKFETMGAHPKP